MSRTPAPFEHLQKVADSARFMVDVLRQVFTGADLLENLAIEPLLADAVALTPLCPVTTMWASADQCVYRLPAGN